MTWATNTKDLKTTKSRTAEGNVKLVVILAHFSDLGKMHGPAKEVYKWSDPSGTRESSSHNLTPLMIQKYRLSVIKKLAREIEVNPSKKEEAGEVEDLQKDLMRRSAQLDQMQEVLLSSNHIMNTDRPF